MSRFSIKVFWSEANQGILIIYSYGRYTSPPPQNFSWVFGKMGCLGNSKTEDQRNEEKAQREANKKIEKQLQKDKQIYRATHRLLLLGRLVWKLRFCQSLLRTLSWCAWRHQGLSHFVAFCVHLIHLSEYMMGVHAFRLGFLGRSSGHLRACGASSNTAQSLHSFPSDLCWIGFALWKYLGSHDFIINSQPSHGDPTFTSIYLHMHMLFLSLGLLMSLGWFLHPAKLAMCLLLYI